MPAYRIAEDDLTGPDIAALLRLHLDEMHQWSPPESVHAMPLERLRQPDVTFLPPGTAHGWPPAGRSSSCPPTTVS